MTQPLSFFSREINMPYNERKVLCMKMKHDEKYYHDLVVYELRTRKGDFDAWQAITRMVNNPCIIARQEVLFDRMVEGHYLIKVTEAVMDTMKKVVIFEKIEKVEDELGKYQEFTKRYYPNWA